MLTPPAERKMVYNEVIVLGTIRVQSIQITSTHRLLSLHQPAEELEQVGDWT